LRRLDLAGEGGEDPNRP